MKCLRNAIVINSNLYNKSVCSSEVLKLLKVFPNALVELNNEIHTYSDIIMYLTAGARGIILDTEDKEEVMKVMKIVRGFDTVYK